MFPAERRRVIIELVRANGRHVFAPPASFESFATRGNLRDLVIQSSFLAVAALGMTFVILTGSIDLSVGSAHALGGVLAAYGSQYGTVAALVPPLLVCRFIGLQRAMLASYASSGVSIVGVPIELDAVSAVVIGSRNQRSDQRLADRSARCPDPQWKGVAMATTIRTGSPGSPA